MQPRRGPHGRHWEPRGSVSLTQLSSGAREWNKKDKKRQSMTMDRHGSLQKGRNREQRHSLLVLVRTIQETERLTGWGIESSRKIKVEEGNGVCGGNQWLWSPTNLDSNQTENKAEAP